MLKGMEKAALRALGTRTWARRSLLYTAWAAFVSGLSFGQGQVTTATSGAWRASLTLLEYFSLNVHLEKLFSAFGYYWALRGGFDNITNNSNPVVVNSDINSPQFLTFSSYNPRAFTSRIGFLGKK